MDKDKDKGKKKKRSRANLYKVYAALDEIAAALEKEHEDGRYHVQFGGEVHERLVAWKRAHPDEIGEYEQAYRDLQSWDVSKHPMLSKSEGQGVLGFYDPNWHLVLDGTGARKRMKVIHVEEWDAWWEQQEAEFEIQVAAQMSKRSIYRSVRAQFRNSADTLDRVMREEFHWTDE